MTRSLYICRHGHRIDEVDKQWYKANDADRTDPYLSHKGQWQAQQLAQRLTDEPIDMIFSSPFVRALQTAQAIADAFEMPFYIERGLSEWHTRSLMATPPRLPHLDVRLNAFSRLSADHESVMEPVYTESRQAVETRYQRTVEQLMARYAGNLLLVGHGKVVTGTSKMLTGKPEHHFKYPNAGVTRLDYDDDDDTWRIVLNGDTQHFDDVPTPEFV